MAAEKLCSNCSSPLVTESRPYGLHGIYLGRFPFYVCSVCRRVYHPAVTSRTIEEIAKQKGLWGKRAEPEVPLVWLARKPSTENTAERAIVIRSIAELAETSRQKVSPTSLSEPALNTA